MSELRELYQSVILDHNKKPRNFGVVEDANCAADGHNPLCGDKIFVSARVEDGVVEDLRFEGFHELVTSDPKQAPSTAGLGKLEVFAGVREFPMRVKCATLAWHTLRNALEHEDATAKTE